MAEDRFNFLTSDFDYPLPEELIAQTPIEPRDDSRLFVFNRETGLREHIRFHEIGDFLQERDILVANHTKVIPARLITQRPTGGKNEVLLLRRIEEKIWEALIGGRGMIPGQKFKLSNGIIGEVLIMLDKAKMVVQFEKKLGGELETVGEMPLPPYIHQKLEDQNRYQTVYAQDSGSTAAPTAGLHFTPRLIDELKEKGIGFEKVTLHIGLDTFARVIVENIADHDIHTEWCQMTAKTAERINETKKQGGRIIAVGTTSVRVIESAARNASEGKFVEEFKGNTDLFITPGYEFKAVDCLITNFHLPQSTLLMMVSAFADKESILSIYKESREKNYRFYSFGDAMLIL